MLLIYITSLLTTMRTAKTLVLTLSLLLILGAIFAGFAAADITVTSDKEAETSSESSGSDGGEDYNETSGNGSVSDSDPYPPSTEGHDDYDGSDDDRTQDKSSDDSAEEDPGGADVPPSAGDDAEDVNDLSPTWSEDPTVPRDDDPKPPESSWTDMFSSRWTLVGIGIFVGIIVLFMFAMLMYTKIKHDELLKHQMRKDIYAYIKKHPGKPYRHIMKDMNLKSGVLTHHINMLEREEYIKSVQDGIYRRFYTFDAQKDDSTILNTHQQNILKIVRAKPGLTQTDIANHLGITRMLVNYHLKVLDSEGLVEIRKHGRSSSVYPIEENT